MLVLLAAGPVLLPEYRNPGAGRLDPISVALSLASILPIIYGLQEIARGGWQPVPVLVAGMGAVLGWLFIRRQRRLPDPLLNLRLFTDRAFTSTLAAMFGYTMLSGGIMVVIAQYFQLVEGMSALRAGMMLLPGMVAAIISFQACPILARRVHPRYLLAGGLITAAAGLLTMTLTSPPPGSGTSLIVGFVLASLGGGPLVTLGTNLVVGSAPPQQAGAAAAISQTGNEFGYALGVAVIGSIVTAVYRAQITHAVPAAPARARDSLAGAVEVAHGLPVRGAAAALKAAADNAYSSGLQAAAIASAVALGALAALILAGLRSPQIPPTRAAPSSRPLRNRVRASPHDPAQDRRVSRLARHGAASTDLAAARAPAPSHEKPGNGSAMSSRQRRRKETLCAG